MSYAEITTRATHLNKWIYLYFPNIWYKLTVHVISYYLADEYN